jgi:hypothetical protein
MATIVKAGRYEFIGELGRGAMGVVYKAMDPVIGRTVAVKTIRLSEEGTGLSRPELLTRFQTEARAAGLLTHPNIVVVFDAGEEDGLYYITMELVEGKSLQALMDGGHGFPLPRVLRIMEQTCSALQFAHERNVVHRDIKPANLMLTPDDAVKVTDFGTAKILQFGAVQQTAHVMGTPSYMSPEQVKGRAVDGRSDIFSLGVMLYEMLTGEKPFPGESITTVIYKIVNEDPIPPRQLNASIHPGISDVVMRALAKDPELRYQSCREMLDDLKNYRALGSTSGNPDSTLIAGNPNATVAIGAGGARGLAGLHGEDPMVTATARALASRAGNPMHTPAVRRTGTLTPHAEPKKKSVVGTVFAALCLLGVIAYGGNKLRPVFEEARQKEARSGVASGEPVADTSRTSATAPDPNSATSGSMNGVAERPKETAGATPPVTDAKPDVAMEEKSTPRIVEPGLSPPAAAYKGRVEGALMAKGLSARVKVQGAGNTLTLAGKLRPGEHGDLLKFMRSAPAKVHVVDHIEYDDTPGAGAGDAEAGGHPVPAAGHGAIHVVTDVIGAQAVLRGPAGHVLNQCQTPCSFNNLQPKQYSLEVQKDGYKPVQTALQVKAGEALDQKIALESLTKGLLVNSRPPGADVFINGAKQSGQTPVTLPLAAGTYNLVLRLQGHQAYAGSVQVKDNIQTQLDAELKEKSTDHVAWAQVNTTPKGAEIFVDGTPTSDFAPARVQVQAGTHTFVLKLNGYQAAVRRVEVTEGGTVNVEATLKTK